MEQILSMERLSALVAGQMCRGVRTNHIPAAGDDRGDIAAGALYAQPLKAGLLLLHRRAEHWLLHCYLPPEAGPFALMPDRPVVTELPFRLRDKAAAEELTALFRASGFQERLRRVRLTRPAGPPEPLRGDFALRPAQKEDLPAALALLAQCFDPLTGCLPSEEALARDIVAGNLLCALDEGGTPAGLLHSSRGRGVAEIRHLAVHPDLRGRHCGQSLLAAWLTAAEGEKARVWTGAHNEAALHTYRRAGFETDGWQSVVMTAGE